VIYVIIPDGASRYIKMKKLTRRCPRTMTGKHYFVYQYDLWMNERELDKPKECKYCGIIDDRKE